MSARAAASVRVPRGLLPLPSGADTWHEERQATERTLHAMCQPLTALLCMLELGRIQGDHGSLMRAVEASLGEAERLAGLLREMQSRYPLQPAHSGADPPLE